MILSKRYVRAWTKCSGATHIFQSGNRNTQIIGKLPIVTEKGGGGNRVSQGSTVCSSGGSACQLDNGKDKKRGVRKKKEGSTVECQPYTHVVKT